MPVMYSGEYLTRLYSLTSLIKINFILVNSIQDTLDSVQRMLQDQQQKVQTMSLNLSTSQVNK